MKPIYLEWSAFGPFANKVVLDIGKMVSEGVFLVHGATGAGKTTIFDAISFALFGNASGEYRQVDSFRSDFAKDDVKTYVMLEFSHDGNNYKVERSPAYRRPKQRGEGYTDSKAEAVLCMPDGNKIIGYQMVTEKIEEILSLDWKQFKQISMIAQGEFLKLLTVESKERGEIFRKVFHTKNLERIGKQLKEQLLTMKRNCEEVERSLIQYYHSIEYSSENEYAITLENLLQKKETVLMAEVPTILSDLIQIDKREQKVCEEQMMQLEQRLIQLQLKEAKQQQLREKRKEWDCLEKQLPNMLSLQQKKEEGENRLFLARKADTFVRSPWELYQRAKKETDELLAFIEEKKEKVDELKKQEEQIVLFYQKAQADKVAMEQLFVRIEQVKIEQKRLQEKEEQEQHYKKKEEELVGLQEQLNQQQRVLEQKEEQLAQCKKAKELLAEIVQKGRDLEHKEKELKQEIEQLKIWANHFKTYEELQNSYQALVEEITKRLEKQQKAVIELQKLEAIYTCEQAGILALELKKGYPCPVCGSLYHPKPAKVSYFVPKREELEEKRAEYEYSRKRIEELGQEAASKKSAFEFLLKQMDLPKDISMQQLMLEREELETLRKKELSEVEEQINALVKQQEEAIKTKEEERIVEAQLTKELLLLKKLQETYQKRNIEKETLLHTIQRMEQEITYKTMFEVEQALKDLELEQKCKKQEIYLAEQNYQDWNTKNQSEEAVLEQLLEQKLTYLQKEQRAKQEYEKGLFLANFDSEEEYKQALLSKEEQFELEKEIQKIERDWLHYKERRSFLEQELKKEEIKDNEVVSNEIQLLLKEKEKQKEQHTQQVARLQHNEKLLEQIRVQIKKQEQLQKQYSEVAILSQVANGELAGKEKLPFEQYVQAFYLEQVLIEANLRLKRMSGGRYVLLRKQEAENKRSITGLDLEVMDYFTGKARNIKSLSGGESFKAALALALGLSDVIQKYAGGIKVETMFIDEGFGSLDKDSLEQAISILKDLATGNRMVGIISHVEELKECIEKKIVVKKSISGSTIEMQM